MAKVQLSSIAENIRGKLSKRGVTVMRKKKYRADNGAVLSEGSQEAYDVLNPRDYMKKPPKGAELRNITTFGEASHLTTLIIRSVKYTDDELAAMLDAEREQTLAYRTQYQQFKTRFLAQLKTPDPQAPVLPRTDSAYNHSSTKIQRRQYRTLNTFIRAMLLQALKSA